MTQLQRINFSDTSVYVCLQRHGDFAIVAAPVQVNHLLVAGRCVDAQLVMPRQLFLDIAQTAEQLVSAFVARCFPESPPEIFVFSARTDDNPVRIRYVAAWRAAPTHTVQAIKELIAYRQLA